jgi:peroxiredoxin
MPIAKGDNIPDVKVMSAGPDGPTPVQTGDVLGKGKVVLFGVPGAFTPTCSDYHLPGFVLHAEDLADKGVDAIACMAVNDAFVMGAWAKEQEVGEKVVMLADGSGDFTRALGLEMDLGKIGLGTRCQRFAAIIDDGVVTDIAVEIAPGLDVSSVEAVLAKL